MTIQEAIQLAVDNGYNTKRTTCAVRYGWAIPEKVSRYNANRYLCEILLDPLFWQALGKGLGWESKLCPTCGTEYGLRGRSVSWCENYCEDVGFPTTPMFPWQYHWHRLIDHLAEGKSIEDFFANLPHE